MIKAGILGGASPQAGELIRLLVNHPDVKLSQIYQSGLNGRDIRSVHHGLIGECALQFADTVDFTKLDVVFIADDALDIKVPAVTEASDLCVVDMVNSFQQARQTDSLIVYGVPEVNRKALVRGARRVVIPSAEEIITCIALLPLALRSMLPSCQNVNVYASEQLQGFGRMNMENVSETFSVLGNREITQFAMKYHNSDSSRVMRFNTVVDLSLPLDNIIDIYEEIYDDHNLTYIVGEKVDDKEVEGTDKCIITLDKLPDGMLSIEAVADARLRGGAGDAVHVMNLLMGLYEKTGLSLRASAF